MSDHKGWRVKARPERGDVLGMVREGRLYRSKVFHTKALARAWAMGEAARLRLDGAAQPVGRALMSVVRPAYLASLLARGRSPSHLRNVGATLAAVEEVAPDLAQPLSGGAIERWLDGLGGSPASRNRKLVEVRALCRWLMRRDILAKDPTRAIDRAHVPDAMRPQFTIAEVVRLLWAPTPGPAYHRRIALLLLAGLRSDEAAALTWEDIDVPGSVILIRAHEGHRLKRGRERIVPLQPALAAILGDPGRGVVAPLPDSNPRRMFPDYLAACGVPLAGRSQHSCRHTYAGIMTATGVPGPLLSAYLGHSSAATTMLYTRLASLHVSAVSSWPRGQFAPS